MGSSIARGSAVAITVYILSTIKLKK